MILHLVLSALQILVTVALNVKSETARIKVGRTNQLKPFPLILDAISVQIKAIPVTGRQGP
jgi:hypothetical protein